MPVSWIRRPEIMARAFETFTEDAYEGAIDVADQVAEDAEKWMKANAPWQDRTFAARRTLFTQVVIDDQRRLVTIRFGHGVPYGIFLELARGGKFGIISKAIDLFGPQFMRDVAHGPFPYKYNG